MMIDSAGSWKSCGSRVGFQSLAHASSINLFQSFWTLFTCKSQHKVGASQGSKFLVCIQDGLGFLFSYPDLIGALTSFEKEKEEE